MSEAEIVAALARFAKRDSHGVRLKARDLPAVRAVLDRLSASGIPVVRLVPTLS